MDELYRVYQVPLIHYNAYHIQLNYCNVLLGFTKLLEKLVVKYVSTYITCALFKQEGHDGPILLTWVS